jgi:hypothetical protein
VPTWAESGGTCGDTVRCIVGTCPAGQGNTGICPTVIPDGQPCGTDNGETCDVEAECRNGSCALLSSVSCH